MPFWSLLPWDAFRHAVQTSALALWRRVERGRRANRSQGTGGGCWDLHGAATSPALTAQTASAEGWL